MAVVAVVADYWRADRQIGRGEEEEGGSYSSVRNTTASVRNRESSPPYFPPLHTHSKIYISDKHLVKQQDEHISIQRNTLEMI